MKLLSATTLALSTLATGIIAAPISSSAKHTEGINLAERQVPCYGPGCHYRDPKKVTGEENLVERQVPCYGPGCHYRDPKKVTSEENLVERQVPCYGPGCHYRDPKRVTDTDDVQTGTT